ncbi:MAG: 4-alpha-glucanotransferase [Gemmatimonadetes bacterium]|nr:4-alpha-glucanotransferase [Gemmatimonadota bacterium]
MAETGARVAGLAELSRLYGVRAAYRDAAGRPRRAGAEAVLAILRALGAPVERPGDVRAALRERRRELWGELAPPVHVAWDGRASAVELRLPASRADAPLRATLRLEDGDVRGWRVALGDAAVVAQRTVEGERVVAKRIELPGPLPPGYHHLRLEGAGRTAETLVVSAPTRAYGEGGHEWGIFLPLYALRSRRSLGIGDLTDLGELARWTGERGGAVVATLPLFSAFLGQPFDPSPYAPVSRLFWNEIFADPERAPELERAPAARELLASPRFRAEARRLAQGELVDYHAVAALKRRVLEELARAADPDAPAFRAFVECAPRLHDYARFRAATRRLQKPWPAWPEALREGRIGPGDVAAEEVRYHEYVQFLMDRQLTALATADGTRRARLYLDIPVGVHRHGFDTWCERALFPEDVCAGAPPDLFFTGGQNWGFPPTNPETLRRSRYRYFIDSLRAVMPFAGVLRFDHVMALHRLYWIPPGFPATEGAYVHYRAEELFAILSLESHRHRTRVVGEDLGTVPRAVRVAMGRHNVSRMYVLQFEVYPDARPTVRRPPRNAVASLNTHDLAMFAAFLEGADIEERRALGLTGEAEARAEAEMRHRQVVELARFLTTRGFLQGTPTPPRMLDASLKFLGSSPAWLLLLNLEDLLGEMRPQNLPGTGPERPNWRRRARLPLEEIEHDPDAVAVIETVDRRRREQRTDHA